MDVVFPRPRSLYIATCKQDTPDAFEWRQSPPAWLIIDYSLLDDASWRSGFMAVFVVWPSVVYAVEQAVTVSEGGGAWSILRTWCVVA
jgi:hypothetical protein